MTLKLNFDHILKPFTETVKKTISLPTTIQDSLFETVLRDFFDSETLTLNTESVHSCNHLPPHLCTFFIKAEPLDSGFYLTITPPACSELLEKFYHSKTPFNDERLNKGAIGYLLTTFIQNLNNKKGLSGLSLYVAENEQTQETLQSIKVEIKLEDAFPLVCQLYFPESFVENFLKYFEADLKEPRQNISFISSVVIGHVKLSKEAFDSCQIHDAIILDENLYLPSEQKGLAKLQYQGVFFAQARINHNTIKFLDFNPLPDEVTMEQDSESPLKSLSDVNLEFQVEFARLNLNFSEFEKLTTGQTLELFKDNPTSCYLTLQGQRVARGELVKIGEKMAFLIEELKS